MPYSLIPDGFTLKKVTKAQEKAVNEKRRHEDIKELLGNELAMTAILTPIIAILAGTLGAELTKFILGKLKAEGVNVTDKIEREIKETVSGIKTGVGLVQEAVETGRVGATVSPVSIPVEDLPELMLNEALKRIGIRRE